MDNSTEILTLFRKGNHTEALKMLYSTLLPKVQRYVKANNGNLEDANDIFQDAVIIVYKQVKTNTLDTTTNIEGYLFTVAKNRWINKVKRDAKIRPVDELPDHKFVDENIADLLISEEREKTIKNILNQLGEQCEKLLNLIFYQGQSLAEVTELMQFKTAEIAHTTHYRCKKKLKKLIGESIEFKNLLKNHGA